VKRQMMFSVRLSSTERKLIARIAAQMERNESDAVRQVIREAARLLGLAPTATLAPREEGSQTRLPLQS
jgi:hypothetical protein